MDRNSLPDRCLLALLNYGPNPQMATDPNPYAPPTSVVVSAQHRSATGTLPIAVVSATIALAFIGFTIVLFQSSSASPDRKAAIMFMFNVPALIGMAISSIQSTRISARFGAAAVVDDRG